MIHIHIIFYYGEISPKRANAVSCSSSHSKRCRIYPKERSNIKLYLEYRFAPSAFVYCLYLVHGYTTKTEKSILDQTA